MVPHAGDGLVDAALDHTYTSPGTYEATLTVTDDTGRTATTARTIEVAGGEGARGAAAGRGAGDGASGDAGADEAADPDPALPATGGGLAGGAVLLLVVGLAAGRQANDESVVVTCPDGEVDYSDL